MPLVEKGWCEYLYKFVEREAFFHSMRIKGSGLKREGEGEGEEWGRERGMGGEGNGWGKAGTDCLETCRFSPTVSFELSCCHSRFNRKKSSPCEMKRPKKTFVKLSPMI